MFRFSDQNASFRCLNSFKAMKESAPRRFERWSTGQNTRNFLLHETSDLSQSTELPTGFTSGSFSNLPLSYHVSINTKWRVCSPQETPPLWLARSACASARARFPFSKKECASISPMFVENCPFSNEERASISPIFVEICSFSKRSVLQ